MIHGHQRLYRQHMTTRHEAYASYQLAHRAGRGERDAQLTRTERISVGGEEQNRDTHVVTEDSTRQIIRFLARRERKRPAAGYGAGRGY